MTWKIVKHAQPEKMWNVPNWDRHDHKPENKTYVKFKSKAAAKRIHKCTFPLVWPGLDLLLGTPYPVYCLLADGPFWTMHSFSKLHCVGHQLSQAYSETKSSLPHANPFYIYCFKVTLLYPQNFQNTGPEAPLTFKPNVYIMISPKKLHCLTRNGWLLQEFPSFAQDTWQCIIMQ